MPRDYEQEAYADHERSVAIQQWMKDRVAHLHTKVTAGDVLSRHGVTLNKHGGQEEQISCPFHGTDNRPSARYFPDNGQSKSHVWCFVCHENWDLIGLWRKFNGEAVVGAVEGARDLPTWP